MLKWNFTVQRNAVTLQSRLCYEYSVGNVARRLSKKLCARNLRVEFSIADGHFILDDKASFLYAIRCPFYVTTYAYT